MVKGFCQQLGVCLNSQSSRMSSSYLFILKARTSNSFLVIDLTISRSSHPDVFLGKGVLKICNKFTAEHPCRSEISIKLICNFIEITLRHGCFHVNLLHIFRTLFLKNSSGQLLLNIKFLM